MNNDLSGTIMIMVLVWALVAPESFGRNVHEAFNKIQQGWEQVK